MNNTNAMPFLVGFVLMTLLTPIILEWARRQRLRGKEDLGRMILKKEARHAFVLYAIGVIYFLAGLAAEAPIFVMLINLHLPSIFRFEYCGYATCSIIYNTVVLS